MFRLYVYSTDQMKIHTSGLDLKYIMNDILSDYNTQCLRITDGVCVSLYVICGHAGRITPVIEFLSEQ